MTAPIWVPLVVGGCGLVGTVSGAISGVIITQRRSDRREAASWEREHQREREQWTREDVARTFEHRRVAYVEFYESLRKMALRAYDHGMGLSDEPGDELPEGWQTETFHRLQHLQIFATASVSLAASEAYSAVWWWGHRTRLGRSDHAFYEGQDSADSAEADLLSAIRSDLMVPDEPSLIAAPESPTDDDGEGETGT